MRILFSILMNALILFILAFFLAKGESVSAWIVVSGWFKTYLIGGIILWLINVIIRPIIKLLSLPLFFIFLSFTTLIVNWIVLWIFEYIIENLLIIPWVAYEIKGAMNFIIAVAIFTVLNMFYSLLFSKK